MDKILTKKILGLKVEDILKCVILVGVGYCIAVMLGNCNCVEGLPFVCRAQTACSRDQCVNDDGTIDLDCEACPGWQLKDPDDGTTEPWITTPSRLYTCESREGSNVGYGSMEECIANTPYSLAEGPMGLLRQRDGVPECNAAPPYSPPTPPPLPRQTIVCENGSCNQYPTSEVAGKTGKKFNCLKMFGKIDCGQAKTECEKNCNTPPPPPPPPSVCAYYGDGLTRSKSDSKALDSKFWRSRSKHEQGEEVNECTDSIGICRDAWQKWADDTENTYTGFCIQTLKDGSYENASTVRGDCPLKDVNGKMVPDTWITSGNTPEQNCTSKGKVGNGNAGDFAWVSETLDTECKCEEDSGNTNTFTPPTTFRAGGSLDTAKNIERELGIVV